METQTKKRLNPKLKFAVMALCVSLLVSAVALGIGWGLQNYYWTHTTNWNTNAVFSVQQNSTVIPSGGSDTVNITGTTITEVYTVTNNGTLPLNLNCTTITTSGNMTWTYPDHAIVSFPFVLASLEAVPLTLTLTNCSSTGSFTVTFSANDNAVS